VESCSVGIEVIEPSVKTNNVWFSCIDRLQNSQIYLELFCLFFKQNESKLFHLSYTFRVSFLIDCPYHFKPESVIDLLGTSILQLQIHDLAGGERGEFLVSI